MTLSKPEDIDDEPAENNGSEAVEDATETTVELDGETMPVGEAVEENREMVVASFSQTEELRERNKALKATVREQREMLNELTDAIEMMSETLRENGMMGVSPNKDLRDTPVSFGESP
jgi:methyl-accepting chemotaxis protein